ncbi:MAG: biopolymer transporter ExbD [Phycisphaerales bacterium]
MKLIRRKTEADYSFDLTALIDVTFLLLAFFVMGSQFAQAQREPMDLPRQPGEQASAETPHVVLVDLLANGTLRVDNQPIERDALLGMLKAEIDADKNGTGRELDLTIRAEQTAKSGLLSSLAKDVARVGVRKWKIATMGGGL